MKKALIVLLVLFAAASAAMADGIVTVYMPSPAGLANKLAADFEAKTGIEVRTFQGTTGEILARLETEQANPVADVVILASWSDGLSMKESGQLESYVPANADKMVPGWIDDDSCLFGYSASAVGVIYNTLIYPELDADWAELADSQYRDTFEALGANGMVVPGANKAALEAVTTGEVGILLAGVDYNAYSSIDKGEPLAIYYPASGTVVNPRPAMIMKTAPEMDNAKLFVDYLLSDDAQRMVTEAYLLPGRMDIEYSNRSTLDEIPQIECDWDAMMEISTESAARINELCAR